MIIGFRGNVLNLTRTLPRFSKGHPNRGVLLSAIAWKDPEYDALVPFLHGKNYIWIIQICRDMSGKLSEKQGQSVSIHKGKNETHWPSKLLKTFPLHGTIGWNCLSVRLGAWQIAWETWILLIPTGVYRLSGPLSFLLASRSFSFVTHRSQSLLSLSLKDVVLFCCVYYWIENIYFVLKDRGAKRWERFLQRYCTWAFRPWA